MQYHTGKFSYYCDTCGQGFADAGYYKEHMDKHRGVRYACNICLKSFARERVYQSCMSVHTGMYNFKCDVCEKEFNLKSSLQKHIQCHL